MRVANQFIDPTTGETWSWPINHSDETGSATKSNSQGGVERNITVSAPVGGGVHIRQEAAPDPLAFSWKGTALTRLQHQKFLYWYKMCDSHSIILQDFSGDRFEVLILAYIPVRKAVVQNRNDMTNAPLWVYDYSISLDVIAMIAGDYHNAGIQA
jgi:hypothetical protein